MRDAWLRGDDVGKVRIGLCMNGVFPFGGGPEMEAELSALAHRWPELADECAQHVADWKRIVAERT